MENNAQTIDAKHIFIDIVNYTHKRSVEAQTELISYLNNFVKSSIKEMQIKPQDVIYIPTGDGMCISLINLFSTYDIHLIIALEILKKIEQHNLQQEDTMRKFNIRIGINENIDNLIIDINNNRNISGSGINIAARIESLGDANQILIGNSVFEKLSSREKYMNSFYSYNAEVKHGLTLKVHQYYNKELTFLNNEIPTRFRVVPKSEIKLNKIQAYYVANCIKHENFITNNIGTGKQDYSLQLLMTQLAEDFDAKSKVTKLRQEPKSKIGKRSLQEHFDYLQQKVDFWIVTDLNHYNIEKYIKPISNLFSEQYLIINDLGKKKLFEDFPEIYKEIGIEE